MITLEEGYLIAKVYVSILAVLFVVGWYYEVLGRTELIAISSVGVCWITSQYIKEISDFYTYYLYSGLNCLVVVVASLLLHIALKTVHSKRIYQIYFLVLLKFISNMILHRVRVVIYDTDEPIMWLINSQSAVVLLCDLLVMIIILKGILERWNLRSTQSL